VALTKVEGIPYHLLYDDINYNDIKRIGNKCEKSNREKLLQAVDTAGKSHPTVLKIKEERKQELIEKIER